MFSRPVGSRLERAGSISQLLTSAFLPDLWCSDLCRSLALISLLLMLLSPLICTTFGKTRIAMETEILIDSEGITNRKIVESLEDRKLLCL